MIKKISFKQSLKFYIFVKNYAQKKFFSYFNETERKKIMFISPINNSTKVSFGHIYSNAVDTIIKHSEPLNRKQEAKLLNAVERAAELNKSVITASTSKGLVLLTANSAGSRDIHKTYSLSCDAKTNISQLEDAVKDAERLEKTDLAEIKQLKGGITASTVGRPESVSCNCQHIYNNTLNGYTARF